jgi:hypothetical protein
MLPILKNGGAPLLIPSIGRLRNHYFVNRLWRPRQPPPIRVFPSADLQRFCLRWCGCPVRSPSSGLAGSRRKSRSGPRLVPTAPP